VNNDLRCAYCGHFEDIHNHASPIDVTEFACAYIDSEGPCFCPEFKPEVNSEVAE
jgi:hypothetical protein